MTSGQHKIPLEKADKVSDLFNPKNTSDNNLLTVQDSIPYVLKLIEEQKILTFKVGPQCRILEKDALAFKTNMSAEQLAALEELNAESEKLGLDF